jgi:hypothetical protein
MKHSLHRGVGQAKGFYALYTALICVAAVIVLIPGSPLGLFTEGVQVLAGVLLPAATVFLLMLCNDKAVLGPWVNTPRTNAFTGAVIAVLITLSVVLTASVILPAITASQIFVIMGGCAAAAVAIGGFALTRVRHSARAAAARLPARPVLEEDLLEEDVLAEVADKHSWRMPPLSELPVPVIKGARRVGLLGLRGYLAIAMIMVVVKVVETALGH